MGVIGIGRSRKVFGSKFGAASLSPLFIDSPSYTKGQKAPTGATTVISVTDTTGNVLTCDTTVWSSIPAQFPIAVKYTDGTYGSNLVTGTTSSTITVAEDFSKEVASLQAMHSSNGSIHLTEYGYFGMAELLANASKNTSNKGYSYFRMDMDNLVSKIWSDPSLYDAVTGQLKVEIRLIGGAGTGGMTPSGAIARKANKDVTFSYKNLTKPSYVLTQGGAIDRGIELDLNLPETSRVELYAGSDVIYDPGRVVILNSSDVEVFSEVFYGASRRIVSPNLKKGDYKLRVITTTTGDLSAAISDIVIFKATTLSGKIFKPSDKVLFLTDSWGEHIDADPEDRVNRYDDSVSGGKCSLPVHFAEYSGATSIIAAKGSMTSAWGRYWVEKFIEDTNPTHLVIHFGINDELSSGNVASTTASPYDFSPTNPWSTQMSNAGGVFASTSRDMWVKNIKEICRIAINKSVQPIVFLVPKVGSEATSIDLQQYNLSLLQGLGI